MAQRRYGDRPFAQPFASTVRIDESKSELFNVCANENWVSTISFLLKNTHRFYTNDDSNYGHKYNNSENYHIWVKQIFGYVQMFIKNIGN